MAEQNLFCPQGTDFSTSIDLVADDGTGINVANYIFFGAIRQNYYSANVAANLIITVTDATTGNATLSLPASASLNLEYGRYIYAVQFLDTTSNSTYLLLEGDFNIIPSAVVTQITATEISQANANNYIEDDTQINARVLGIFGD